MCEHVCVWCLLVRECVRVCVCVSDWGSVCVCVRARVSVGVAAGVTWTSRTTSAYWAARQGHTTVIDAAGAIYVIGGSGDTYYSDVWKSTDRGA